MDTTLSVQLQILSPSKLLLPFLSKILVNLGIDLPEGLEDFERLTYNRLRIGGKFMEFDNPDEAEFIQFAVQGGASTSVPIPIEPGPLHDAITGYRSYLSELAKHIEELASSRTQDRKLKQRIVEALRQKLGLRSLQADKTARLM